ncbi:MAG: signal peptidase I [Eubacteriales bacterium]
MKRKNTTLLHKSVSVLQKAVLLILCAVLIINIYEIVMRISNKDDLPKIFGFAKVVVVSGSMQPALEIGDLLIIQEKNEYHTGEIITVRIGKNLVTHRVTAVRDTEVITQGDQNNITDEPNPLSMIEGMVIFRIPKAGGWIMFLKTPPGIVLMSLVAIILIETPYVMDKIKRKKT